VEAEQRKKGREDGNGGDDVSSSCVSVSISSRISAWTDFDEYPLSRTDSSRDDDETVLKFWE